MRSYYLRLSVTDRCDLRCVYCRPRGGRDERPGELDAPALLGLVDDIDRVLPLRKIRMTGGEPLLRRDLVDLVAELRRRSPALELCLTTNGLRLGELAEPLRRAGLDRLNVSLDSADPRAFERITGGGRLAHVVSGLEAARAAGFRGLRLNAVLLRSMNGGGLASLVRLARDHDAEIRFIELMPIGDAASLHADEFLSAGDALALLSGELGPAEPLSSSGTARRYRLRMAGRETTIGFVSAVSEPFCSGCDRLRLDSRGRLYACLRQGAGLDLVAASRTPAGVAGLLAPIVEKAVPAAWEPRRMVALGG